MIEHKHFLCFIGKRFYTRESFTAEAATLGISRRIAANQIPEDLVMGKSKVFVACEGGHDADKAASVFGYFIPDALEFIGGTEAQQKQHINLISRLKMLPDTRILGTVEGEPARGCGMRKVGGCYLVVDKAVSPLTVIERPALFDGNHFRGLMRLNDIQAKTLERGGVISVMSKTPCMTCGKSIRVPPSTLKRAKRAQTKRDEGKTPEWVLNCDDCKALFEEAS